MSPRQNPELVRVSDGYIQLQLELAGSYWQVLLAGLVAICKACLLLLCQGAPVGELVRASD